MSRVGVIVLAAGRSTRFGPVSKLLTPWRGHPIVSHAVAAAVGAQVGEVVVVTGDRAREVEAALDSVDARVVYEPNFADGMAASLGRGVRELHACDAIVVGLGDVPEVRSEAYRRVVARWRDSGASIIIPRYASSTAPSHPTLFAANIFSELLGLRGDVGARSVVARDPSRVVEAHLEWPAPQDVDTEDDLKRLSDPVTNNIHAHDKAARGSISNQDQS